MWKKKKNIRKMAFNTETVLMAAKAPLNTVLTYFQTTSLGLTDEEVEKRQGLYGKNEIVHEQKKKPLVMLAKAFINPFVGVLTVLVAISYVMDVWMADPGDQDWTSIIVVSTMIILSTILRFVQEWKANRSSEALQKMVTNTCYVMRLGTSTRGGSPGDEISNEELVPGDLIMLSAGDMIPADVRIIESKDLFVSQSSLTGESDSIEKFPNLSEACNHTGSIVDLDNICFMGSNVVSGSAKGIVFATGSHTYLNHCQERGGPSCRYGFRQGNHQGESAAHPLHAHNGSYSIPGQRNYEGRLVGGFHLRHLRGRGTYPRDVADDCNRQPFERSDGNVAQEDHRKGFERHSKFRCHEHSLYRQDGHPDAGPHRIGAPRERGWNRG